MLLRGSHGMLGWNPAPPRARPAPSSLYYHPGPRVSTLKHSRSPPSRKGRRSAEAVRGESQAMRDSAPWSGGLPRPKPIHRKCRGGPW